MIGIGVIAGLGLLTVAAVMAWKRSQSAQFFASGRTLSSPSKGGAGTTWQPTYGEAYTGDAINPSRPGYASYIVLRGRLVRGYAPPHMGFDISAPMGTPVFAVKDGTVVYASRAPGYGLAVGISHGPNESTWYAHLNQHVAAVGMQVYGGQVIGEVGRTSEGDEAITTDWGQAMGAHLHFEVHPTREPNWRSQTAARRDPAVWLRQQGIEFFGGGW